MLAAPVVPLVGLALMCVVFYFWRLDAYTLFDRTEAETAEVARQMVERGDWVTPVFNGIRYFDKPVLLYWLMAVGFSWFGVSEWTVRLPSAIFATTLIIGTYYFVLHVVSPRVALLTATMLAANPYVFGLGRTGVTDIGLGCLMTGALFSWYWAYSRKQTTGYLLAFGFLGGAVLMKGPIGLLLPVLIVGSFLLATGQLRAVAGKMPWGRGLLLILAINLPWYVAVTQANGWQFLETFFIHHNFNRFTSVIDLQPGPWYYYLLYTPAGFFPWIALLPLAFSKLTNRRWLTREYWRTKAPAEQLVLFLGLWFVIVLAFLSAASTKLPHYIMPALPALALLCALVWDAQIQAPARSLRIYLGFVSGVLLLLAVGFAVALQFVNDPALPNLRSSIEAAGLPWLLSGLFFAAALAVGVALVFRQLEWVWAASLGTYGLLFVILTNGLMPVLEPQIHGHLLDMAAYLRREVRPGDLPATLGVYAPSLNFYGAIDRIPVFEKSPQVRYQMAQSQRLLLVTTEDRLQAHWMDLRYPVIHTAGIYKLYDIPPRSKLLYAKPSVPGGNTP